MAYLGKSERTELWLSSTTTLKYICTFLVRYNCLNKETDQIFSVEKKKKISCVGDKVNKPYKRLDKYRN